MQTPLRSIQRKQIHAAPSKRITKISFSGDHDLLQRLCAYRKNDVERVRLLEELSTWNTNLEGCQTRKAVLTKFLPIEKIVKNWRKLKHSSARLKHI